ncbi:AHH domain-containing protein [Iodobacter sp. CM08]|uniref:AHH domain-containing protein n=1 Tax=Iodobacter sp. CM08 TaxID=3085902 RepID=UPI0029823F58|nr:AHH domain-containing protein [Iodobacter sp. CM08]MDW5419185.1 AHH domain-containing protein [Iodobacter sp. CM08]
MLGNIGKDSKYLNRIKDATAHIADHPRHHGIKMQAHHLISADGVHESRLGKKLAEFGYDINLLPNLVFIPSSLQGACHLSVQPHRGNHTAPIASELDDDLDHPDTYHTMVSKRIREMADLLSQNCPGDDAQHRAKVTKEMNKISNKILNMIQKAPALAPLTYIASSFSMGANGCKGVDQVPTHRRVNTPCPVDRNHEDKQGKNQNKENIKYKHISVAYQLKAGS